DRDVRLSFTWNDQKTFLRGTFRVTEAGKVTASGIHEIGADPVSGRLRSWVFNDDGGEGKATWSSDGNSWMIESIGAMPDGTPTSATNVLTRLNDNEFTWRSIRRSIGAEGLPDTTPVKLSRIAAPKGS